MKTEDELDADIAKLFDVATENAPDGNLKKRLISEEETIAKMEREEAARRMEACGMFLTAERRFQKLNSHPDVVTDPKVNVAVGKFGASLRARAGRLASFRGVSANHRG